MKIREIISTSAEDTLTTLKIILDNLTEVCSAGFGNDIGLKILCQIKNTMSDRAANETKFNSILITYRETCLPLYREGWDRFSNAAESKLIKINNIFVVFIFWFPWQRLLANPSNNLRKFSLTERNLGQIVRLGKSIGY